MKTAPLQPGMVIFAPNDTKLWFLFHHGPEGSAAIDLTTPHPGFAFALFEKSLKFKNPSVDQTVLLGGPERAEDALLILHATDKDAKESHRINDDFSFLSYRFVLIPGQPPAIHGDNDKPTDIMLKSHVDFLITLGYRGWESGALEQEIAAGLWNCLQPRSFDIFGIPHENRRNTVIRKLN